MLLKPENLGGDGVWRCILHNVCLTCAASTAEAEMDSALHLLTRVCMEKYLELLDGLETLDEIPVGLLAEFRTLWLFHGLRRVHLQISVQLNHCVEHEVLLH